MTNDPYQVLGIPPSASQEEVKRAYRNLAKQYHPDLHPGDAAAAQKMNAINAAYAQIRNGTAASYTGQNRQTAGYQQTQWRDPTAPFGAYSHASASAAAHQTRRAPRRHGLVKVLWYVICIHFVLQLLFSLFGFRSFSPYRNSDSTDHTTYTTQAAEEQNTSPFSRFHGPAE